MSDSRAELKAMEAALAALEPLESNSRRRVAAWLLDTLSIAGSLPASIAGSLPAPPTLEAGANTKPLSAGVTQRTDVDTELLTPKEFIGSKRPTTVVERVACLAYYLTHYRSTPHFRGADITALNTEAAAPRLNSKRDLDNADRRSGYLVSAGDRKKQITTRGEELVRALPDRDRVKEVLAANPHQKRRSPSSSRKRTQTNGETE